MQRPCRTDQHSPKATSTRLLKNQMTMIMEWIDYKVSPHFQMLACCCENRSSVALRTGRCSLAAQGTACLIRSRPGSVFPTTALTMTMTMTIIMGRAARMVDKGRCQLQVRTIIFVFIDDNDDDDGDLGRNDDDDAKSPLLSTTVVLLAFLTHPAGPSA